MLAFTAIFILMFFGLQYFKPKKAPETAPPVQQNLPAQSAAVPASKSSAPVSGTTKSSAAVTAVSESSTVVENELYRIQFTNRGAQVTSWILKKYKDADGKPLDLVNKQAAAQFGGARKRGHRLARRQPDVLEPGTGLVKPGTAESPE